MKRVTLLADRIDSEGTTHRIYLTGDKGPLYIHGRHVLSVEGADARDFAPPVPAAEPSRILTTAELDALPIGSVVDATAAGERCRFMLADDERWTASDLRGGAESRELSDAILVPTPPIQPAPVAPLSLPTEPGARFWGKVGDGEPRWWFVRSDAPGDYWYLPSSGMAVFPSGVARRGLVRLPEPDASDVTA